jgi:hypothetical protein
LLPGSADEQEPDAVAAGKRWSSGEGRDPDLFARRVVAVVKVEAVEPTRVMRRAF